MSDPKSLVAVTLRALPVIAAACALVLASGALAADPPKTDSAKTKPMNMDEPMAGGMKKEGMKKGDVKKAADKKDSEMRKMIENEQQSAGAVKK
jgi:pentapeptide MXKDX repeat protein